MTSTEVPRFNQFPLAPAIQQVIGEIGFETPTPIQAESIPPLLAGRDLLGQAQTGTGKTAAFALPLLSRLNVNHKFPQLLVLAPTRELALQVAEEMQTFARHLPGFQVLPIYGGQNMALQLRQLQRGVQVVVGTPGRIQDHLRRSTLKLDRLMAVVVDEADEMLKMGFLDAVEQIIKHAPAERQVALFSATMPNEILRVARRQLKNAVEIRIKSPTATVSTIAQYFWQVRGVRKLDALTRIFEAEEVEAMLVFVRTKLVTVELSEKLEARGLASAALNGDMTQQMREKTIEQLKNGTLDIVVATDVAARGLDVQRISHVVNYDMPHDSESYVHRIGRTGRAGRAGKAIIFVAPRERRLLAAIEQATRQSIAPMLLPSRQDVFQRRINLFKEQISEAMADQELDFFEELIDNFKEEYDVAPRRIAAALAYLLQKERPLQANLEDQSAEDTNFDDQRAAWDEERSSRGRGQRAKGREAGFGGGREGRSEWQRYRLEVGRSHGVEPGNIVGAITNEANLSNREIGAIKIYDSYSLVDLPLNLSPALVDHLETVWICGKQTQLHREGARGDKQTRPHRARPGPPSVPDSPSAKPAKTTSRAGVKRYPAGGTKGSVAPGRKKKVNI